MDLQHNLSSFITFKCFQDDPTSGLSTSSHPTPSQTEPHGKKRLRSPLAQVISTENSTYQRNRTIDPKFPLNGSTTKHKRTVANTTRALTGALDPPSNKIVCAIYEVRNHTKTRIGICFVNLNIGLLTFSEFIDSSIFIRTVHKLQIHEPTELIFPYTSLMPLPSKLVSVVKSSIPESTKVVPLQGKLFNVEAAVEYMKRFNIDLLSDDMSTGKFTGNLFGLQAIAGALEYITSKQGNGKGYPRFSHLRSCFESADDTMLIDSLTIHGLELTESNIKKGQMSLLRSIDSTSTPMGKRLLKTSILQPLTNKDSIELRQNAVMSLLGNDLLLDSITSVLKGLHDLDIVFSRLLSVDYSEIQPEQKINYVLIVKDIVCKTLDIQNYIQGINEPSSLLLEIFRILNSPVSQAVLKEIDLVIEEDCHWAKTNIEIQHQRIYAVKNGSNGLLEATRNVFKSITEQIYKEIENTSRRTGLNFTHNYIPNLGFVMSIPRKECPDVNSLPDGLINQVNRAKSIECSSMVLQKLNSRLKDIITEICLLSEKTVHNLLNSISKHVPGLFMISEAFSMLDLMCSFAHNSIKNDYCIPTIGPNMHIKDSKHPVLSKQIKNFVSNDIISTKGSSNLQIITGCNMSGKSVYLKQVAMLCILCQMGSPIPAKIATVPIFKNLHSRLCSDSLEFTSSSFMFEMKEVSYCLDELTEDSLLLLDELGRNTSASDGLAISLAITEYVLQSGCTSFISTHFQEIPQVLVCKPAVIHLRMKTTKTNNKLNMMYTIHETSEPLMYNALQAVSGMLHQAILDDAHEIRTKLQESKRLNSVDNEPSDGEFAVTPTDVNQMKKIYNFIAILEQLAETSCVNVGALQQLQRQFIDIFGSDG